MQTRIYPKINHSGGEGGVLRILWVTEDQIQNFVTLENFCGNLGEGSCCCYCYQAKVKSTQTQTFYLPFYISLF